MVLSLYVSVRFGNDTNEIRQMFFSLLLHSLFLSPSRPSLLSLILWQFFSYLCAIIKTVAVEKRSRMARWICAGGGGGRKGEDKERRIK